MEVSSPLAAMRPSGLCSNNWGGMGSEGFAPRTRRSTGTKALFGPPLGKNPPSYFQTAHHYESSPTSHLVMDMSANFHLDKTSVVFRGPPYPVPPLRQKMFAYLKSIDLKCLHHDVHFSQTLRLMLIGVCLDNFPFPPDPNRQFLSSC